ncbi:aspartate/glutamate racemase family protein [Citrobacter freundii]|uniref:aspartate/glutamate racemase family protein n=1 Tax=Citrobacter freundii TaxID=546 RepID=UPI0002B871D4|nr:amino acid racemase [Citrobacter freundii]EMF23621.1 aspartate racemase [Citrobacter freundii GTC 09479]
MKGLIGVLGGMGPAATVDLFNKFVTFTAAQRDQEHIPLIISSIPDIPDRTDALMHHGHSPLPAMRDYMHKLEDAGAECIVIPCNTAHFWFNELKECCHTELLSIVETTMDEVKNCGKSRIGLLATNATLYMGLYQKGIESLGLTCVSPDSSGQEKVMDSIYCLKAGDFKRAQTLMNEQAEMLFSRGAEVIVLGCTEVPVILANAVKNSPDKYIDSTGSLVRAGIKWYEKRVGKHHLLAQ